MRAWIRGECALLAVDTCNRGAVDVDAFQATMHRDRRLLLLSLRRRISALADGSYQTLESGSEHCFVYLRERGEQRLVMALNCSEQGQVVRVPGVDQGRVLLSTYLDREGPANLAALALRSQEGCIIEIKESHTL